MHNLIMNNNLLNDIVVDHQFGDTTDNRKENLRICKRINNMKNLKVYANNKSGHKGVFFSVVDGQWKAYINCDGKRINLGYYLNKEDAIVVRERAEIKYFGEYNRAVI